MTVRPFVLPHFGEFSAEAHRRGSGPRKWTDQQGFYVYRNRRLLVAGSWLRLGFVEEEHNKLARIQLDFTNELDFAWDINVRKSRAVPPDALREDLIRIAKKTREVAQTIYRHRGATIARQHSEQTFMWEKKVKHSKVFYRINASHPAVSSLMATARKHGISQEITNFLHLIEETIPVPLILIDGQRIRKSSGINRRRRPRRRCTRPFAVCMPRFAPPGEHRKLLSNIDRQRNRVHRYPELLSVFKERERIGN